jgi:hypothetical protein
VSYDDRVVFNEHIGQRHPHIADVAEVISRSLTTSLFDSSWSWVNGMPIGGVETDEQRRARQKKESEDWHAARLRGYLASHGAFGWPPFA